MMESQPMIRVGTSGYSYDDWIGPVYPAGTIKEEMLAYYATSLGFDVTELNDTYYTMPAVSEVEGILKKVPDRFRFVVKAHNSITHRLRDKDGAFLRDETAVETFLAGLAPMIECGALICVLAQFPLKFGRSRDGEEHLKWLAGAIAPVTLAVELRNRSWMAQSVFDLLKSIEVSCCMADTPALPKLAAFTPVATARPAYFRFHGRNRNWFDVPAHQRYNYRYSDLELRQFLEPVKTVTRIAGEAVMFFNNHFQGAAVANARQMKELLGQK